MSLRMLQERILIASITCCLLCLINKAADLDMKVTRENGKWISISKEVYCLFLIHTASDNHRIDCLWVLIKGNGNKIEGILIKNE